MRLRANRKFVLGVILCGFLATAVALVLNAWVYMVNVSIDLPAFGLSAVSSRTHEILRETDGTIDIQCVMSRSDARFESVGHLLRSLQAASRDVAGATIELSYIDPVQDYDRAAVAASLGATGDGILFSRTHRHIFVRLEDLSAALPAQHDVLTGGARYQQRQSQFVGETVCAAAIARLFRREGVALYWLTGHGEPDFTDTAPEQGFSTWYRELQNEGFEVHTLNLLEQRAIPETCEVLMLIAPHYPVTLDERAIITDYLDRGGRLFFMLPPTGDAGLNTLLEQWGIVPTATPQKALHQLTGQINPATHFSEHPITRDFINRTSLYTGVPRDLTLIVKKGEPFAKTPLVGMTTATGSAWIAVAVAGGEGVADDIALRTGRMIVVGDAKLATNALLRNRATANRDFLLNCIQWLADVNTGRALSSTQVLFSGQSDRGWMRAFLGAVVVIPAGIFLVVLLITRKRPS